MLRYVGNCPPRRQHQRETVLDAALHRQAVSPRHFFRRKQFKHNAPFSSGFLPMINYALPDFMQVCLFYRKLHNF